MRWNKIFITLKKELMSIYHDKKTLIKIVTLPLIIPAFVFLIAFMYEALSSDDTIYEVGFNYELTDVEKDILSNYDVNINIYETKEEMLDNYEEGNITAFVYLDDVYTIYANTNDTDGYVAYDILNNYLETYDEFLITNYLEENNISLQHLVIDTEILGGDTYYIELILEIIFPYIIMIITSVVGLCTVDMISGEKEKGTLETLLTFPIKTSEIITGKMLSIFSISSISGLFSLVLGILSVYLVVNNFSFFEGTTLNFGIIKFLIAIIIILLVSLLVTGLSVLLTSKTKTFKEGQSAIAPLQYVTLIPILLPLFEVESNALISIIPVISQAMLLNDLFLGNINTFYLILSFLSSTIFTIIIICLVSKTYKKEEVLFSS